MAIPLALSGNARGSLTVTLHFMSKATPTAFCHYPLLLTLFYTICHFNVHPLHSLLNKCSPGCDGNCSNYRHLCSFNNLLLSVIFLSLSKTLVRWLKKSLNCIFLLNELWLTYYLDRRPIVIFYPTCESYWHLLMAFCVTNSLPTGSSLTLGLPVMQPDQWPYQWPYWGLGWYAEPFVKMEGTSAVATQLLKEAPALQDHWWSR